MRLRLHPLRLDLDPAGPTRSQGAALRWPVGSSVAVDGERVRAGTPTQDPVTVYDDVGDGPEAGWSTGDVVTASAMAIHFGNALDRHSATASSIVPSRRPKKLSPETKLPSSVDGRHPR